MAEESPLPAKIDVARALLLKGSVFIHLDPRVDEVSVPPWLKRQPQLVLQVGLDMALPIPDLVVDEAGVSATLSFNRSPFYCIVPWSSVFALVGDDGRGLVWPESMPVEIAAEVDREAQRRGVAPPGEGEGPTERRVERIVGKAVREKPAEAPVRAVRTGRGAKGRGKVRGVEAAGEAKSPSLQLIRGESTETAAAGRGGLRRRRSSHLRVVK